MQEAFVAALLAIARNSAAGAGRGGDESGLTEDLGDGWVGVHAVGDGDLEELVLWVEIKKQIEILREGMEDE
jgi:hypothetical protein